MEAESRSNGQDALEDLAADASSAMELDTGRASVPRQVKRVWMSSPESASSAVLADTWPVTGESLYLICISSFLLISCDPQF